MAGVVLLGYRGPEIGVDGSRKRRVHGRGVVFCIGEDSSRLERAIGLGVGSNSVEDRHSG